MAVIFPAARGFVPDATARENPPLKEQLMSHERSPPRIPAAPPATMPVEEAEDQQMARNNGTQPELTGMEKRRKTCTRGRSRLFPIAVSGQMTGIERMVVSTIAQSENFRSSSW